MRLNKNRKPIKAETNIEQEATDLLFEVEDVAQLVAEITGEDVDVTADENEVTFEVAGESYTCEAEGDEEVVEMSVRAKKSMRKLTASRNRKVTASRNMARKPVGKTVKRFANKRK
ncbi:hypothetical protein [Ruminococcus sp.]|uniref:hypothetical protein n=1 Tax=Ruminococcus sp. TaxID=41978 RepID=UPI001B7CCE8F|nr:hypothetical protein [Ruminococcus sp.]MBP5433671.1 hypothetical protein [Ruminococcus sp.]